jgi:hypothetical protein
MYRSVVYFAGPMSVWARKPVEAEVIASFNSSWGIVAQIRAQALVSTLKSGRCGWALYDPSGALVDHVIAPNITTETI